MFLIRSFEEKIVKVYPKQKMRTPVHLCIGQEAIAAAVIRQLKKSDVVFTYHRCHGHLIAKGADPCSLMAELYGRKSGCCQGKGGSCHLADSENNVLGTSAIVGGTIPIAAGAALGMTIKKKRGVVISFLGDGAMEAGVSYESLNIASLFKLPIVFICENNFYATQTPLRKRQCADNIYQRAASFKIPSKRIDGNSVFEVYEAASQAIERAKKGQGPSFIEARTYRYKQHVGPYDDTHLGYRTRKELNYWMKRDPIKRCRKYLLSPKIMGLKKLKVLEKAIKKKVEAAHTRAKKGRLPKKEDLAKHIY
jgi:pyruvate dehydrogenase E1 component alpha subunit